MNKPGKCKMLNKNILQLNFRKRLRVKNLICCVLILSLWIPNLMAQQEPANDKAANFYLPQNRYKTKENTMYKRVKESYKNNPSFAVLYSYHQTNFLNDNFAYLIENDELDRRFGSCLKTRIEVGFPFLFDIDWFSSRYFIDSPSGSPLEHTSNIRHRGLEVSCNLILLPVFKYFHYYIGLGYQSASLIASNKLPMESTQEDDPNAAVEKEISYYSNCSAPIWKAGFTILMGENFLINAEYKQSFKPDGLKSFNQLSIGLGARPSY